MATVVQDVYQIRHAVYGREVREAIADGIEQCYTDTTSGVNKANAAASAANSAASAASAAASRCYEISTSQISGDDYRLVCTPASS